MKRPPAAGLVICTVPRGLDGMGGIERQLGYLADAMAQWRAQGRPDVGPEIEMAFVATRGPHSILLSPFYLLGSMARLAAARLRRGPVLVHVSLASYGSTWRKLLLTGFCRLLGLPTILHLHGAIFDRFFASRSRPVRGLIRGMFRAAGHVLVLGAPWRDFVVGQVGVPAERVTMLPNAVPDPGPRPGRPADAPCRILFLGRLGARKGVPELIAALAELQAGRPGAHWHAVLAGDGDAAGYRRDAAAAGLAGRIDFPGWQDGPAAAALLAAADIFVLPSHAENLPVSVLEAASYGLPIVTTPVGAVPDHFSDGANALIVPPGEVAALAAALTRLVDDPALRRRLGDAARQTFLERFSIAAYRDRLVSIYRGLLAA